jgi:hypothetical protein
LEVSFTVPEAGQEQGQQQGVAHDAAMVEHVAVYGKLTGLTNLKELDLWGSCLVPGDALALTALTGLTQLVLQYMGACCGRPGSNSSSKQLQAAAAPGFDWM